MACNPRLAIIDLWSYDLDLEILVAVVPKILMLALHPAG